MKLEISHDALARTIYEKASAEDRTRLKIKTFIITRYEHYKENRSLLKKEDINYISPYLGQIDLNKDQKKFIRKSYNSYKIRIAMLVISTLVIIASLVYILKVTNDIKEHKVLMLTLTEERRDELERMQQAADSLSQSLTERDSIIYDSKEALKIAILQLHQRNDTLLESFARHRMTSQIHQEQLENTLRKTQSDMLVEQISHMPKKERKSAISLSYKAWELNHQNTDALKYLYKLNGYNYEKDANNNRTEILLEKAKKYTSSTRKPRFLEKKPPSTIPSYLSPEENIEVEPVASIPMPSSTAQRIKEEKSKIIKDIKDRITKPKR